MINPNKSCKSILVDFLSKSSKHIIKFSLITSSIKLKYLFFHDFANFEKSNPANMFSPIAENALTPFDKYFPLEFLLQHTFSQISFCIDSIESFPYRLIYIYLILTPFLILV